ncbi:cytochrome P450 [Nostoc sp. CHAB 5836]|uniref:cytochrome P450 n=1 Tax=Nostoc sp. CHAB 5836 TaxID=2780404 RepID=UPI001E46D43C|nr:cytochrome P450 [Nostoc sp. CHAB 5836]MCC5618138.1 cytochrome P450 [Nostoc sp. CHAB 5836]
MTLPEGPSTLAFLQIYQWSTRPANFLDSNKHYGDIFSANFPGGIPNIFISSPEAIEEIFCAPPGTFDSGGHYEILKPLVGENSSMLLDGKPYQRQRKLLMPPFHGERIRVYGNLICQQTEQVMQQWQTGVPFNVTKSVKKITLEMILRAVFGLNEEENLNQVRVKLQGILDFSLSPFFPLYLLVPFFQKDLGAWSVWGRFLRLRNEIDQILFAEIVHRRKEPQSERSDILSLLMAACDEEGNCLSKEELRDEMMTIFMAGQHTVEVAVIWALYWIHKTPRVLKRLQSELSTSIDLTDINTISQLSYLNATCQEVLRFYPPILTAAGRIVKAPFKMMGYEFPVGSFLFPSIYSAHHRSQVYSEPEEFRPERFLERQYSAYEYLPFGGGNRRCIGYAFAQYQMKIVLASILSRYQLELVDNRPVFPVRSGPGLGPSRDIWMKLVDKDTRGKLSTEKINVNV